MTPDRLREVTGAEVAPGVRLIDLLERGEPRRLSGFFVAAPRPAVVETGPSRSVKVWLDALRTLTVPPADVAYIIVTHIHLDHSGGAGTLLHHLPGAQVVVHPRGARHLVDPSRLVASARGVFGDRLEEYFGLPEPAPEGRLLIPDDGGELDLGGGHRLRFIDAPGHARHQYMILDQGAGTLWSGDEFGIRYANLPREYVLPNTPPTQFDPDGMLRSARLLLTLQPEAVLFSHFGRTTLAYETLSRRLQAEVTAFAHLGDGGPQPPAQDRILAELTEHVQRDLAAQGLAWTPAVERELAEDLAACAQGIADYRERRFRQSGGRAP